MKIARYQRQVALNCRVAIIPNSDLTGLFEAAADENKADVRLALDTIGGWISHVGPKAHCIGCNRPFADTKVGGFAVLIPAVLTKETDVKAVSAGVCRKCISRPRAELHRLFGRALQEDRIATLGDEPVT